MIQGPLYRREAQALAAVQRLRFFPLEVERGEGCYLIEVGGRRLLDLSATWSAAGLGYGHPRVVRAVNQAMNSMPGVGLGSICQPESVALAEQLLAMVPGDGDRRVYLGHSGSDANEAVVRAIRRATGRDRLLAFHGSYHGGIAGSSQFSGLMIDQGGPRDPDTELLTYPTADDPVSLESTFADLDLMMASGPPPAAIIVEPVMSDGGVIVPPSGFLRGLRERAATHGALLICDEVKVGLGRTGLLHAFQMDAVTPDVVTLGKSLGGGLPIGAAVGPATVLDVAEAFTMLTTAGNPVCSAAARAVLDTILDEEIATRAKLGGETFLGGLRQLAVEHSGIRAVRGRGLILGVELSDESPEGVVRRRAHKVAYRAWQLGLVMFCVGPDSAVLELTPPLIISPQEIDVALGILDQAIREVATGLVSDEEIAPYLGW